LKEDEGDALELSGITERIIGCAFTVANTLGIGFLETFMRTRSRGLTIIQQRGVVVRYNNFIVGEYIADLLVESQIIIELKVVKAINDQHAAQCMNYLRATGIHLCLLINFERPRIELRGVTANVQ
jgi:GxxExxY protein